MANSYVASMSFQLMEMVTIFIRWLTLCVRIRLSMAMSLLIYKVFFSITLVRFKSCTLGGVIAGLVFLSLIRVYYVAE